METIINTPGTGKMAELGFKLKIGGVPLELISLTHMFAFKPAPGQEQQAGLALDLQDWHVEEIFKQHGHHLVRFSEDSALTLSQLLELLQSEPNIQGVTGVYYNQENFNPEEKI